MRSQCVYNNTQMLFAFFSLMFSHVRVEFSKGYMTCVGIIAQWLMKCVCVCIILF